LLKTTRILPAVLCILLLSSSAGVLAAGFWDTDGHWANRYIQVMDLKGVITGFPDESFRPDDHVTREQAIVMIVRALGYKDDEVRGKPIPSSLVDAELIPGWAAGHVAVAVEQGILSESDLVNFRGMAEAWRLDIAQWVVRAMGLEDEAETRWGEALAFTDTWSIPLKARGYVAVIDEKGIMTGFPDGSFRPFGAVTRAQMATLLARMDKQQQNSLDEAEIRGTLSVLKVLAPASIILRTGSSTRELPVPSYASIYRGDTTIRLGELVIGEELMVLTDEEGRAVYIEVISNGASTEPKDELPDDGSADGGSQTVTLHSGVVLYVEKDHTPVLVLLREDGTVERLGVDSSDTVEDVLMGQSVTAQVSGDQVVTVSINDRPGFIRGRLTGVLDGLVLSMISVKSDAGDKNYNVAPDCKVYRDGEAVDLKGLEVGDRVAIRLVDGEVKEIYAESRVKHVSGTVSALEFGEEITITVDVEDGQDILVLGPEVKVTKNGKPAGLTSIRETDEVLITLVDGVVTEVEATSVKHVVEGTITAITIAELPTITIDFGQGNLETYPVGEDVVVRINGEGAAFRELNYGYAVTMTIEYDMVTAIDAEVQETSAEVRGQVRYIDTKAKVLLVAVLAGTLGANDVLMEVEVTDETLIVKGGETVPFSALAHGDTIAAFGEKRANMFSADTIVIIASGSVGIGR